MERALELNAAVGIVTTLTSVRQGWQLAFEKVSFVTGFVILHHLSHVSFEQRLVGMGAGIEQFGVVEVEAGVKVYAYEVDGLGGQLVCGAPH